MTRSEPLGILGINRVMPGNAHIIDKSKRVLARGQVLGGESVSLSLVCKVCLAKIRLESVGRGLRATPMADYPCSTRDRLQCTRSPSMLQVFTMDLRMTRPDCSSSLARWR